MFSFSRLWRKKSLSTQRPARKTGALRCESLEQRRLLTISSSFASGVLDIWGNDDITVYEWGGNVLINGANPSSGVLAASAVTHINILGGGDTEIVDLSAMGMNGGFDSLVETNISFDATSAPGRLVFGSPYRDVIFGTDEDDVLIGDAGDDEI